MQIHAVFCVRQTITEFQKISLSKRGYQQNLCCESGFYLHENNKKFIFISMSSHLASLSNRGLGHLGNGLILTTICFIWSDFDSEILFMKFILIVNSQVRRLYIFWVNYIITTRKCTATDGMIGIIFTITLRGHWSRAYYLYNYVTSITQCR